MNNVSRTLRGQYSSSGSLRVVVGALCVAMCVPVLASNDQSATVDTQSTQVIGEATREAYLKARLERDARREERRLDRESRHVADSGSSSARDSDFAEVEDGTHHRSLKRALADSSEAAAIEQRKNLTREERRAIKRELRDAMLGANSGDLPTR
ncbi:MAG: hypothetical protein H2060_12865 [Azoarcus sp.]|nr:hypothetical protein [Azoarcus sp.]